MRMMCAGIDSVDISAFDRERSSNRILNGFKFSPAIITTADTGLIGDHDHRDAPAIGSGDHFRGSRNHDNVFDPAQIPGILNDRAVAVQKQSGAAWRRAPYNLAPDPL